MKKERAKGFITGMLVMALAMGLIGTAAATVGQRTANLDYKDIKITLNGQAVTPTDANGNVVEPFAIDGTIYLPVRAVGNALGLDVKWDAIANTARLTGGSSLNTEDKPQGSADNTTGSTTNEKYVYYSDGPWVPDFGAIYGLKPAYYNNNGKSSMRTYDLSSFDLVEGYTQALEKDGFLFDKEISAGMSGTAPMVYIKDGDITKAVTIDLNSYNQLEVFFMVK